MDTVQSSLDLFPSLMAKSIDMSLSPEISKPSGRNIRRNSVGTPFFVSSGEKPVPHYLRASIGSCHDFCKYGRKHAFEADKRSSMHRISITPRSLDENRVKKVFQADRKKAAMVKPKPLPDSKAGFMQRPQSVKLEVSSPSKKVEVSLNHGSADARGITDVTSTRAKVEASLKQAPNDARGSAKHETPVKLKLRAMKPLPSPDSLKHGLGNARGVTDVTSTIKKEEASLKQLTPNAGETSQRSKSTTPLKLKPITVNSLPSPDHLKGSGGRRNNYTNIGQKTGTSKVTVKKGLVSPTATFYPKPSVDVVNLNAGKNRSPDVVSPLKNQNRVRKAEPQQPKKKKIQEKTLRTTLLPKSSLNQVASLNAKKYKSLKVVFPLNNLNKTRQGEIQPLLDNDKVLEKTFYVVKADTNNKTLGSDQDGNPTVKLSISPLLLSTESSSQPSSPSFPAQEEEDQEGFEYTVSDGDDFILEDDGSKNINETENPEGEYKRRPQKVGVILSEDTDYSAVKLNFRRGRVLDLNSESKGPRRLRFRQRRLLGEDQNGKNDAGRRSFKRQGVDGYTNGTKDESEKVVLKHQDVQGKKDAQGLLNNVIEETASKLVESRKSKVKALVGAFETVISLQETKPSSTNTVT